MDQASVLEARDLTVFAKVVTVLIMTARQLGLAMAERWRGNAQTAVQSATKSFLCRSSIQRNRRRTLNRF